MFNMRGGVTCSGLRPLGGAHQSPHGLVPAVTGLSVETVPSTCQTHRHTHVLAA